MHGRQIDPFLVGLNPPESRETELRSPLIYNKKLSDPSDGFIASFHIPGMYLNAKKPNTCRRYWFSVDRWQKLRGWVMCEFSVLLLCLPISLTSSVAPLRVGPVAVISESCRRETCGIVDDPEQFQVRWPETWKCPVVTGISPSLPFPQTLSGTFAGLDGHWTTPRSISSQPAPCIYDCVIAAGSSAVSLSEHKKINQTFRQIYNRFYI